MRKLYCDASFDWNSTDKVAGNVVRGKIAISDGNNFKRIEKIAIGKVEGLKQYINIIELTAIARAVELAYDLTDRTLEVFTDSQTAMWWARNGIKNKEVITAAHASALDYLKRVRLNFQGEITFNFIPRLQNPAGLLLQAELDNGHQPHEI